MQNVYAVIQNAAEQMRLKIVSDGTGHNTKVLDDVTGEALEGVTEITWHCAPGEFATVEMKLLNVGVWVTGRATIKKPHRRRRIETG